MKNFLGLILSCMGLNFYNLNAVEYTIRHSEFDFYQSGKDAFYTTLKQYIHKETKFDIATDCEYLTLKIEGSPVFKKSIKHGVRESLLADHSLKRDDLDPPKLVLKRTERFTTENVTTTSEECLEFLQSEDKSYYSWFDFLRGSEKSAGLIVLSKVTSNTVYSLKIPVVVQE